MRVLDNMKITAAKVDVLATIRKNRETHAKIVEEARAGYMVAAKKLLSNKLQELEVATKPMVLMLHLDMPQDHTKVYDTVIKMLEMHQGDTIELDSTQVRNLVMDEWDWKAHFVGTNALYSQTAAGMVPGDEDN